jgi:squalene synthase HpnC
VTVWNFARELEKWGPRSGDARVSLAAARAYCAFVTKSHYENFTVASLLLPRRLIRHFHAVYAYCRWSDDLADETAGGQEALALIAWWRAELLACYSGENGVSGLLPPHPPEPKTVPATSPSGEEVNSEDGRFVFLTSPLEGEVAALVECGGWGGRAMGQRVSGPTAHPPRHPVMLALRETIRRFHIPPRPFLSLLSAFEEDQRTKRYETFEQLTGYCNCSANPVGHLVLMLFECFDAERELLSNEVCTGLQLANFWQDVARDFARGRVYLPAEDRRRFDYTDEDLEAKRCTPAFRELMRFQVERARGYFDRGAKLLPLLPREAQVDVDLFIRGGLAILRAIEKIGYDVWSRRPEVSKWEKGKLLLGTVVRRVLSS